MDRTHPVTGKRLADTSCQSRAAILAEFAELQRSTLRNRVVISLVMQSLNHDRLTHGALP